MTSPAIQKLMGFLDQTDCEKFLDLAQVSFFEDFAGAHDIENLQDIAGLVGEKAFADVVPCVLGFFFSNEYRKHDRPWNVIDVFLRQRGHLLDKEEMECLRGLRRSYLGLYEILEVMPEEGLTLSDMIEDGTYRVSERSMTRQVVPGNVIAARLREEKGKLVISGDALSFNPVAALRAAEEISARFEFGKLALGYDIEVADRSRDEREQLLRVLWAPQIGFAYLEDCLEQPTGTVETPRKKSSATGRKRRKR